MRRVAKIRSANCPVALRRHLRVFAPHAIFSVQRTASARHFRGYSWHLTSGVSEFIELAFGYYFDDTRNVEKNLVIRALAALAHPVRLDIFRALVVQGKTGLTPGAMAEGLGIPSATLSFHLKELTSAGLVTQERASRNLIYRAAYARMNEVLGYLTSNCCQGQSCLDECKC